MIQIAILSLCVLVTSCAAGRLPLRRICPDGWPIKILQHPECHSGICGYTCEPDRWRQARRLCILTANVESRQAFNGNIENAVNRLLERTARRIAADSWRFLVSARTTAN